MAKRINKQEQPGAEPVGQAAADQSKLEQQAQEVRDQQVQNQPEQPAPKSNKPKVVKSDDAQPKAIVKNDSKAVAPTEIIDEEVPAPDQDNPTFEEERQLTPDEAVAQAEMQADPKAFIQRLSRMHRLTDASATYKLLEKTDK